jgi:hypothetical protein
LTKGALAEILQVRGFAPMQLAMDRHLTASLPESSNARHMGIFLASVPDEDCHPDLK